jgi:hypothetical protein
VLKAYICWNRAGGHRSHLAQDGPLASSHEDSNEMLGVLKAKNLTSWVTTSFSTTVLHADSCWQNI